MELNKSEDRSNAAVSLTNNSVFRFYTFEDFLNGIRDNNQIVWAQSWLTLSEALELETRTKAKKFFTGQSQMPRKVFEKLASLLELTEDQSRYLDLLRQISYSKNAEDALGLYKRALRIKHQAIGEGSVQIALEDSQVGLLEKFSRLVVLYYFHLKNAKADVREIMKALHGRLSEDEVNEAMTFLLDCGLLVTTEEGLKPSSQRTLVLQNAPIPALRRYHQMMIQKAEEAIYGAPMKSRFMAGTTLVIRKDCEALIKKRLEDFIISINQEFDCDGGDELSQINVQFLNLAEISTVSE